MIATHHIQDIQFENNTMQLKIDGKLISLSLDRISTKLQLANDVQLSLYKVSPSGYGIHWPLIDEDLSVEALLKLAVK